MRLVPGSLIALVVAYSCLGQAADTSPVNSKRAACPTACAKASACAKQSPAAGAPCAQAGACCKTAACETATACDALKACPTATVIATMVPAEFATACAALQACASTSNCESKCATKACGSTPCNKAGHGATQGVQAKASECRCPCAEKSDCCTRAACDAIARHPERLGIQFAKAAATCPDSEACPQVIATDACCQGSSGACCKAKNSQSDSATAVASDEACEATACQSNHCFEAGSGRATARVSHQQLEHLAKAAEHLAAAGLDDEAGCVREMAEEVRQELIALMKENIANLQAEIAALGGACESECQTTSAHWDVVARGDVPADLSSAPAPEPASDKLGKKLAMNFKIVEVNLDSMRQLGFNLPGAGRPGDAKAGHSTIQFSVAQPEGVLGLVSALERECAARVLNWPTVVMANGGTFEVAHQESGAKLDVHAKLLDSKRTQIEIRTRSPGPDATAAEVRGAKRHTIDAGFEMELGQTAVLGGPVQQRVKVVKLMGLKSSETKQIREQVQTLFLVTPELIDASSPVTPASHQEPSKNSQTGKPCDSDNRGQQVGSAERRIRASGSFWIDPNQATLPKINFAWPAEE